MRVICINNTDYVPEASCPADIDIQIGDTLTVEKETFGSDIYRKIQIPCYKFIEYPLYVFDKRNFAPISEIEQTELTHNYKTETP